MVPHLEQAARAIRHHHERYNGEGYPDRVSGDSIPLSARIIAVANGYDNALNSQATFQKSSPKMAKAYLNRHSPAWFDPAVVSALETCLDEDPHCSDEETIEVRARDLRIGMVLARELRTNQDVLLLSPDTCLTDENLSRIRAFDAKSPFNIRIHVYRRTPEPVSA
jgi:hypothetical protein